MSGARLDRRSLPSTRMPAATTESISASRASGSTTTPGPITDRVYGITTGFGRFAEVSVPRDRLLELQQNLVRSHAGGVGDPLPDETVRVMIVLRANALARGLSGIRVSTVERLLDLLAADVLPLVPEKGSVGASGDLAPLAHLALGLTGEGFVRRRGRVLRAARALRDATIRPVVLEAKEGLALVNGVQMSVAVGGLALSTAIRLSEIAD